MATTKPDPAQAPIGTGAARQAVNQIKTRKSRLEQAEEDAVKDTPPKYAHGGMVRRGFGKARGA